MKRKKTWIVLLIAVAVILIGGGIWYLTYNKPATETGAQGEEQILTIEAKNGSVSVRVEGPSVVEPFLTQTIRSAIEGVILYGPSEGDAFNKGDLLIRFDSLDKDKSVKQASLSLSQAVLNRDRARDNLALARTDLSSKKALFESGAVSKDQVDAASRAVSDGEYTQQSAELAVSQAALALDTARQELANTAVKAPFTGVVLGSNLAPGDLISKGAVLITYADLSRMRLVAEVDEFDISKVTKGQGVTITSDALGGEILKSKVDRVSPAAEVINNISIFKVSTLLDNRDGKLKPGMSADISILISSDKGIILPSKAVSTVRTRSYVKVYEEDEIKTKRVTAGADDGINIVVLEGLAEGEIVVVPGTGTAGFSLTGSSQTTSGTSVIPIPVPGTGSR